MCQRHIFFSIEVYFSLFNLARPRHPAVIEYLVDITNVLTGRNDGDDDAEEEDMETVFDNITNTLQMSEKDLQSCHRNTATRTARHIMRFKYPNPRSNFQFNLIHKSIIDSIISKLISAVFLLFQRRLDTIGYTRIANPNDQSSDIVIKGAMGNYIATTLFQGRIRNNVPAGDVQEDHPEEENMNN